MAHAFEVNRILEALIEQEQEGHEFYTEAARMLEDSKAKALFEKLARDEQKHKKLYERMLQKQPAGHTVPLETNGIAYLDLLLKQYSLKTAQRARAAATAWSKDEVLSIAEGMERDTIFFLNEVIAADLLLSREDALHDALKEERQHLSMILDSSFNTLASALML